MKRHQVQFQATPEEYAYISKRAEEEGLSMSEYIRFSCMFEGVCSFNKDALKALGKRISSKYKDYAIKKSKKLKETA